MHNTNLRGDENQMGWPKLADWNFGLAFRRECICRRFNMLGALEGQNNRQSKNKGAFREITTIPSTTDKSKFHAKTNESVRIFPFRILKEG
jgi:hypothetical protein